MFELFIDFSFGDNLNIVLVGFIVLEGDEVSIYIYIYIVFIGDNVDCRCIIIVDL